MDALKALQTADGQPENARWGSRREEGRMLKAGLTESQDKEKKQKKEAEEMYT
jgi:hypothetical protein